MEYDDSPTLWKDMTPEEKGALLLAEHEGKAIEVFGLAYPDMWHENYTCWEVDSAYRIKPEQKRERVTAQICLTIDGTSLHMKTVGGYGSYNKDNLYATVTFDTIDGKPDPKSLKIEDV